MPQVNPKVTNISLNASGGALTLITGTMLASKVEIQEDPTYNGGVAQGLQGYVMDPNSNGNPKVDPNTPNLQAWLPNAQGQVGPAYQPIIFGGDAGRVHGAEGNYTSAQGTPLLQLKSLTPTVTGIILREWT